MRRFLLLFALASIGCSSSESDAKAPPTDTGTSSDTRSDVIAIDSSKDTAIADSTPTDSSGGEDTSVADVTDSTVTDSGSTDTLPGVDTGSDAAPCTPADCADPYLCCSTPGRPFYGKCYNKSCLACC